jgi:predicted DNA-binding antitoxin AbrB/MazE fold protein
VSELYERVDVEFLHEVVRQYSGCEGDYSKLAEKIAEFNGGYTLVAKYAGLWLRGRGCDASDVERAVEEAKKEPKLFLARYIWQVLLRGSGDLARRVAVPLLLHAYFGPVPIGVTYITKAVYEGGVWRLLTPEELKGASLESLKEDALEPIAKWLAQEHEDLVEETLRDLAGLNGEEAREPYRDALSNLIKALDWGRDEVLKEGDKILTELRIPKETLKVCNKIFAKLGVPEKNRGWAALLAYVGRRLTDVFKRDADKYLMIDDKIPRLLTYTILFLRCVETRHARDLSQTRGIKQESSVLTPLASPVIIMTARETAKELMAKWRKRGVKLAEVIYFLGLAALAAVGEVDEKMVDLLLRVAFAAVKRVTHLAVVWLILAALRPLGEKAPHIYVSLLAAASELETLDPETVWYIYDTLQQLKDRLQETGRIWPLVETIRAYSNLVRKHSAHLKSRWEEAVKDMWQLYNKIRERCGEAAPGGGLSAQYLLDTIVRAYVLAATLHSNELVRHAQKYFGDLVEKTEAVRNVLDEAVAHPEELKRIMESDADFAEWVKLLGSIDDAVRLIKNVRDMFMRVLNCYKPHPALCEVCVSDEKDRKKSQNRSKKRGMRTQR